MPTLRNEIVDHPHFAADCAGYRNNGCDAHNRSLEQQVGFTFGFPKGAGSRHAFPCQQPFVIKAGRRANWKGAKEEKYASVAASDEGPSSNSERAVEQ